MIAPDVAIVDLEPAGYSWMARLLAQRQMRADRVVTLLHDGGRVLAVRDSQRGFLHGFDQPVENAQARAEEMRVATGAGRVVVVERAAMEQVAQAVVDAASPQAGQIEAFRAGSEAFWESPGVATSPSPPPDSWKGVAARLSEAGHLWTLVTAEGVGPRRAALLAEVDGGQVRVLTSPPAATHRLGDPAEVIAAVEAHLGARLGLVVMLPAKVAESVLLSADIPVALGDAVGSAIHLRDDAGVLRPLTRP